MKNIIKFIKENPIFSLIALIVPCVLFSSVIEIKGTDVWYVQYVFFGFLFLIIYSLSFWNFSKGLTVLLLAATYSSYISSANSPRAFLCLACLMIAASLSKYISNFNSAKIRIFFNVLLMMGVLQAVLVILQ